MHHANAAKRLEAAPPVLEYARVTDLEGDLCRLATPRGELSAKRATGCLLAPRAGDLVLAAVDGAGTAFVLSVLDRRDDTPGSLDYPGDLSVHARGDLRLDADADASLSATGTVALAGRHGEAAFTSLSVLAKAARVQLKNLSVMARTMEQFAVRLTQRLTNSVKLVAEHDEVQAASARYCVADDLTMQAKNARHIAEDVIKIDAGQVHLG